MPQTGSVVCYFTNGMVVFLAPSTIGGGTWWPYFECVGITPVQGYALTQTLHYLPAVTVMGISSSAVVSGAEEDHDHG